MDHVGRHFSPRQTSMWLNSFTPSDIFDDVPFSPPWASSASPSVSDARSRARAS